MINLRNILTGTALVGLIGCQGRLRMSTDECAGEYREQGVGGAVAGSDFNSVTMHPGDTTLILVDYTENTLDWNQDITRDHLQYDHVDEIRIKTPNFSETITPTDSNSSTLSGRRAKDWFVRGDSLYLATRQCFVDWARRDYLKNHPLPYAGFR